MVVVPALTGGQERHEPVVHAEVTCTTTTGPGVVLVSPDHAVSVPLNHVVSVPLCQQTLDHGGPRLCSTVYIRGVLTAPISMLATDARTTGL